MSKFKLLVLGDSIMWGVTGFDAAHPRANPTIPQSIGNLLGIEVENGAVNATEIVYGRESLLQKIKQYDFRNYSSVLLAYGTNDYGLEHETLSTIKSGLVQALKTIKRINPDIKIYLLCPIQSWALNQNDLSIPNSRGVSQNNICDAIVEIAKRYRLPYFDWRSNPIVTPANRYFVLGDGTIHPTQATMNLMAKIITERMIKMANIVSIERGMDNGAEKINENFMQIASDLNGMVRVSSEGWHNDVTWLNGNAGDIWYCKVTIGPLHVAFVNGVIKYKSFLDWAAVDVFSIPGISGGARITTPVQAGDLGNTAMYSVNNGIVHSTPLQINHEEKRNYDFQFGGVIFW